MACIKDIISELSGRILTSPENSPYLRTVKKSRKNSVIRQLKVEEHAGEGKCLARVDGKVIFIEEVIPGDIVDVQLLRNKKDWAEGRAVFFHAYSPDRIAPFCSHFGTCGGCQWQMLPYPAQLQFKQKQVTDTLQRIGKVRLPAPEPILEAPQDRSYRNKMEYTFANKQYLSAAQLQDPDVSMYAEVAGFHAKGFFDKVVDIQTCHLQAEPTNTIRTLIKNFAIAHHWPFYDIRRHTGVIRNVQIRRCRTGEILVNIILAEDPTDKEALFAALLEKVPQITTLVYTVNTKFNDSLTGLTPVVVHGKGFVIEKLGSFQFKIGPKSFFQTNTAQAERLYQLVSEYAELTGNEILYDLYCGTGSIGIFCSAAVRKIVGIEVIPEAIEDAWANAELNGLTHAQFFTGDVTTVCTDSFIALQGKPDVIITDPPRAGMSEKLIATLLSLKAPRIVYVSCNPSTQARDLNFLGELYDVTRIRPVDMFPHTQHIETIVQLKLKS
ncbi:MAG: 23S rRNA (uracil(1939)-C(5))-methyltransferase RlmD [Chitinophagaceae bacterium]